MGWSGVGEDMPAGVDPATGPSGLCFIFNFNFEVAGAGAGVGAGAGAGVGVGVGATGGSCVAAGSSSTISGGGIVDCSRGIVDLVRT